MVDIKKNSKKTGAVIYFRVPSVGQKALLENYSHSIWPCIKKEKGIIPQKMSIQMYNERDFLTSNDK